MSWIRIGSTTTATLGNRLAITGSSTFDYGSTLVGVGYNETGNGPITWAQSELGSPWEIVADVAVQGVDSNTVLSQINSLSANVQDGIIIHLGGNDLVSGTINSTSALAILDSALSACWSKNASYAIVVVPHARRLADGGSSAIAVEIKNYLSGANYRATLDSRIYVVDHFTCMMDSSLTESGILSSFSDGVHSNNIGARVMAQRVWKPIFDGKIIPRTYSSAISLDPSFENPASWTVTNGGLMFSKGTGSGGQFFGTVTDNYMTQVINKASLSSASDYVLVLDGYSDVSTNFLGIYLRDNTSTWQVSVNRTNGGSITVGAGSIGGTKHRFISRKFKIPQSVINAATNFVFGVYLSTNTGRASISKAGLFLA